MLDKAGRANDAEQAYRRAGRWDSVQYLMRQHAQWDGLTEIDRATLALIDDGKVQDVTPWSLHAVPGLTPEHVRDTGRRFAQARWAPELTAAPLVVRGAIDALANTPLKIGYLSGDFHAHATMHLLAGVLEHHDTARVDVHLYSYGPERDDAYRDRIAHMPGAFHAIGGLSDAAAAAAIARDGIQILVDLKGYTTGARLGISALRPAPVIVNWLGYPGSLGEPRLADYLIGDSVVTPVEHASRYSETLALLPHCYQPNDDRRPCDPPPSRRDAGLPDEGFVFCSFNQTFKFDVRTFDVWSRLLSAVPRSVLWLLKPAYPEAECHLRAAAAARGVDPARVIFANRVAQADHLARLQLADLALDTFPVGSHTTGSDALWAGVPMVTRPGETFTSRVGASLLRAVGLDALIAPNEAAYFDIARSLAEKPERLADVRVRLAQARRAAPLFDTRRFTRDLERLYRAIRDREATHTGGQGSPIVLAP
ncbi:UDP-N-acetylglucosamine-peptide N-acetylglucosaminyltransferase [Burkholderia pyrrocinia]|uniref:O-linked N-acetylglucosamine transferase, SPINDLY family protein n=1 Tax=Burkholderia pyrrocinia TaxID=60550 RepID=UPI001FB64C13|nr:UDP-N-acetylglucosamine-peptide N-acetylglucosaminyltransferase [Burkholderia pyrrocinia]